MEYLGGYYRKLGMKSICIVRKGKNKLWRDLLGFGKGSLLLAGLVWF